MRSQVHRNQKEFYLQEQLKAIRKELGHQNEFASEIDELGAALRKARLPREVLAKAMKELDRLSKMSFMSPEATVVRNYLDWLAALPWNRSSRDQSDMAKVEAILDEDHFGLKKVKERIVEYLAVLKLTGRNKGPILCLVGPPGRGQDLARPLDRARAGAALRARGPGRRARRGRDPRAPPHLHRLAARAHHPEHPARRHPQPGVPARRDRQARRRLPRRPGLGAARGAGPRAEPHLQRPLPRGGLRPVAGDVHLHRQLRSRPSRRRWWTAWRRCGCRATTRARRCRSRGASSSPSRSRRPGSSPATCTSPRRRSTRSSAATRARPGCAASSARSPGCAARRHGARPPAGSTAR